MVSRLDKNLSGMIAGKLVDIIVGQHLHLSNNIPTITREEVLHEKPGME